MEDIAMQEDLFDPTSIPVEKPSMPTHLAMEEAAYTSLLSSSDPIETFKQSMAQFEQEGTSRISENVKQTINQDTNKQRAAAMSAIISDTKLPKEQKTLALQYYIDNKEVYPPLRDTYAQKIASTNNYASLDVDAFLNVFNTKEVASDVIQQQVDKSTQKLSGDVADPLISFITSVVPIAWMGQNIQKGYITNKMLEAAQNKDMGALSDVWNSLWPGSNIQDIRETLNKLPDTEKIAATNRIIQVIEAQPNILASKNDYDRYVLLRDAVDTGTVYTDIDKHLDNLATLLGGAIGGLMLKRASGFRVVPAKSVLGTTAAHNPAAASRMVDSAVKGEVEFEVLGTTETEVIASLLPKYSEDLVRGITPEASEKLRYIDEGGERMLQMQGNNPLIYTRDVKDAVLNRIRDSISNAKNMVFQPGKSSVSSVDELGTEYDMGFKGIATFGQDAVNPFVKYEDALKAADRFQKKVKEGSVQIVSLSPDGKLVLHQGKGAPAPEGEYFVQWQWDHKFNPWDALLYGKEAVKLDFTVAGLRVPGLSPAMNYLATTPAGRYMFAHHAQPKGVADNALRVFDKAVEAERPFMTALLRNISSKSAKIRGELDNIIQEGEESAKIFSFDEVLNRGIAKGMSVKESEDLAMSYLTYRRVGDWMYAALNKSVRAKDIHDGVRKFVNPDDSFMNGWLASRKEIKGVTAVYNPSTDTTMSVSSKFLDDLYEGGGSLVKLKSSVRVGDDIVRYGIASKGHSVNDLDDFVVPYIKGYAPRFYDNAYFVVRIPNQAFVDGAKVSGKEYSHVVAAAKTKQEAKEMADKLAKDDPDAKYDWKRDRIDENSLLEDANQFKNGVIHSRQRGEDMLDNATKIDPLISMFNLVNSMSRYSAMDEFITASRESFVKEFEQFLKRDENGLKSFPKDRGMISKPKNMTGDVADKYKQAIMAYDYLESLMPLMRVDQQFYKESMRSVAEASEKLGLGIATAFRGLSNTTPPWEQLRRLATVMYIYLRPGRQLLLQPSQLALLIGQDIKYLNPVNIQKFGRQVSALQVAGLFYKNDRLAKKLLPDDALLVSTAKLAGIPVKEFEEMVIGLQKSGLLSSVDTNAIVEGVISSSHTPLRENVLEQGARYAESVASFIPKVGKRAGFDIGERFNVTGSWVFARDRYKKMYPDADINSPVALEQIAADAREIALSMNRAGSFQYQRNVLAIPLQFLAVPHKAILSLTTSKMWTPAEKARLAVTQFMLYGAYGAGLYGVVNSLRQENPDTLTEEEWSIVLGGLVDASMNKLFNLFVDEKGEDTSLAISASVSPLSGGIVPFGEFLTALQEDGFYSTITGPSWNLINPDTGRIPKAIREITALISTDGGITEENMAEVFSLAASVPSGGSDWMKQQFALNTGYIVSASGKPLHANVTRAEALGQGWGFATQEQLEMMSASKKVKSIEEEAELEAKHLYDIMDKVIKSGGSKTGEPTNEEEKAIAQRRVQAYLKVLKEGNPEGYYRLQRHWRELERRNLRTLGDSISLRIMRNAMKASDEDRERMLNAIKPYQQLSQDLNEITGSEDY